MTVNLFNPNFFGINANYAGSLFSSMSQSRSSQSSGFILDPQLCQSFSEVSSKGYKNLVKAYCNELTQDKDTENKTNNYLDSLKEQKNSYVSASTLKSEADALENSADTLTKTQDFTQNREKINDNVTKFVKEYNSLLNTAKNNKTSNFNMSSLNTQLSVLSKVNQKSLNDIGINVNSDGTLMVDSDKLKNASAQALEKVFSGNNSFGAQAAQKAEYVSENITKYTSNQNFYNQKANYSNLLNTGSLYNSFF